VYKTIYRFHGFKHIGVGFIGHGTPKAKRWERKDLGNDWLGCKKKFKASKKVTAPKLKQSCCNFFFSTSQIIFYKLFC